MFESHKTKRFQKLLDEFPAEVQLQARAAFKLFQENPYHPSLSFSPVPTAGKDTWSANVGAHYRVLGVLTGNTMLWTWIGSHEAIIRLVKQRR